MWKGRAPRGGPVLPVFCSPPADVSQGAAHEEIRTRPRDPHRRSRHDGRVRAAAPADDRRAEGGALAGRERAGLARDHRAQGDDPDARRGPHRRRHLPPQGHLEEVPDHLGPHALQLQLLGRRQRRPAEHDRRPHGHQAGVRIRRDAGARPVLRRRRMGRPRRPAQRRRRRGQLDDVAAVVQRQGRHDRLLIDGRVAAGGCGARTTRVTRRSTPRGSAAAWGAIGPYYEQGNWYRGGAFMLYNLTWFYDNQKPQRPTFPPDISQEDLDPPVEVVGPRGAPAGGGLVEEGVLDPARAGHPEAARRDERPLRRPDQGGQRRRDDQAHAERPALVQGRALARRQADQRAGPLVHVLLRHRHRTQPRDVQLREEDRQGAGRQPAVGDHRAGRSLRVHPRDRAHHRRRARHGRRAAQLPGDHVPVLRPHPQGRRRRCHGEDAQGDLLH